MFDSVYESRHINTDKLTQGKTGYPWIDAIMRQLREEGWIHHLARYAVACFLTRGDLWLSWEAGQKVCGLSNSFTVVLCVLVLCSMLLWFVGVVKLLETLFEL